MATETINKASNGIPQSATNAAPSAQQESEYAIPNITLNNPQNRHLRISTIGAGVSGIMMAYQISQHLSNYTLNIYEREEEIGGTWWLNRYPGAACDIPSHAYQYAFALNPAWPRFFSPSEHIWAYLDRVCETFDLRRFMKFRCEVTKAEWNEEKGVWKLNVSQVGADGSVTEFEDECDILLHATGVLNKFKWPQIKGIEKFKGKMIHTARWPTEYQEEAWKSDRVAVIGSGASSIQTVPTMQPHVKHMTVFVRTPVWFVEIAGNQGKNHPYTEEQQREFRENPEALVAEAKQLEDKINAGWSMVIKDSAEQKMVQEYFRERTKEMIKDPELAEKIIPKWSIGCRRITPGDPYINAIQQENVKVEFAEVVEITENTVKGKNGSEVEVDTIVCATGFDTSFRPNFPIVGRNGVVLHEKWAKHPEAYLGLAVPDMPNFFTFIGPTWPIGNGSVMGPLEAVGDHVMKFLKKFQREVTIKSFCPQQATTDEFNAHAQEYLSHTVWMDDCRSWYKDNDTGRVNAIWPGSSLHYIEVIEEPRYEDYDWSYNNANRWAWLGNGRVLAMEVENGDKSPYMQLKNIDPKWVETMRVEKENTKRPERTPEGSETPINGSTTNNVPIISDVVASTEKLSVNEVQSGDVTQPDADVAAASGGGEAQSDEPTVAKELVGA